MSLNAKAQISNYVEKHPGETRVEEYLICVECDKENFHGITDSLYAKRPFNVYYTFTPCKHWNCSDCDMSRYMFLRSIANDSIILHKEAIMKYDARMAIYSKLK